MLPTRYSREQVDTSGTKTLAAADQGIVQNVVATAHVITLPATAAGLTFTIRNGGENNGEVQVVISPNSADLIQGNGLTAADDKDVINTLATARAGDEITLVGNGTTGWNIAEVFGTWARET